MAVVAGWLHAEWACHRGEPVAEVQARLARRLLAPEPVAVWVVEAGGEPAGTASLVVEDNPIGPGSLLCLADLIVAPERRGQGIGRVLCTHASTHARGLGFDSLHAFTSPGRSFLQRMGWSVVADTVMTVGGQEREATLRVSRPDR